MESRSSEFGGGVPVGVVEAAAAIEDLPCFGILCSPRIVRSTVFMIGVITADEEECRRSE